jgi:hypothetical protein
VNEITEKKFKKNRRVINEIKEDTNEHLSDLQENSSKDLNEIKKTMQDIKREFNKDTEILKKSN